MKFFFGKTFLLSASQLLYTVSYFLFMVLINSKFLSPALAQFSRSGGVNLLLAIAVWCELQAAAQGRANWRTEGS